MDINYQILFTIELLHEYFMDKKAEGIEIFPSEDSEALFENIDILWRNTDNRFIALIRENDLHEPFINPPPDKLYRKLFGENVFRLYLKLKDTGFYNYSNVPPPGKQIAYFNNLAGNKVSALPPGLPSLYLSQRISNHVIGKEYLPGDFVIKPATDQVFETIKKHTSTAVGQLTDTSLWKLHQLLQFPTNKDLITRTGEYFIFPLAIPAVEATVQIFRFNFDPAAPGFTVRVGEPEVQKFDTPAALVKVDLHELPPERYRLQVNGENRIVYYDPYLNENNVYGVIEIFNHLPAVNDYSFLDTGEVISKKEYVIQFPARNVLWKYIRKDNKAQSITDTGSTSYVFNLIGDEFVSALPIPLSEKALNTLSLKFNPPPPALHDFDLFPLPNPSGRRLGKFHQDGYDYSSVEVFLNY